MAGRRRQQASTRDPEYELRIELAVQQLRDGTHKTINAAAKANQVARQTLSDRFNGLHKSIRHAHHDARLPRFSALFGITRKRTVAVSSVSPVEPIATASVLAQHSTFLTFRLGTFADSS